MLGRRLRIAVSLWILNLAAASHVRVPGVSALEKVVSLLDDVISLGKKQEIVEEAEFVKFHQWCNETQHSMIKSLETGTAHLEELEAAVLTAEYEAEALDKEIRALHGFITQLETEISSARLNRERELKDYSAQHQDLSESADACRRAVSALKSRQADAQEALGQVARMPSIPDHTKDLLESLISTSTSGQVGEKSKEDTFALSGDVEVMLETLETRFVQELQSLAEAEMSSRANFESLLQQQLSSNTTHHAKATELFAVKGAKLSDAAAVKGDVVATRVAKLDDEKILNNAMASCHAWSVGAEQIQVVRSAEIKSVENAVQVLSRFVHGAHIEAPLPPAEGLRGRGAPNRLRGQIKVHGGVHEGPASYLQELESAREGLTAAVQLFDNFKEAWEKDNLSSKDRVLAHEEAKRMLTDALRSLFGESA